jgi:hypothetical protein
VEIEKEVVKSLRDIKLSKDKNISKKVGFRLTTRDVDILGFLMDQKFGSLEQIYFRHFDVRKSVADPMPKNLYVTRQRLQVLCRSGLIKPERVYSEAKSLYLLTHAGYQMLSSQRPHEAYAMPIKSMDFRSYEHDTRVNDCRIAIEKTGKVMKWISERKIRMKGFESEYSFGQLPKDIVPDGIFISSKGERIVFEIETTPRKKSRYKEKLQAYRNVMAGGDKALIHRVFWVGSTDRIFGDLKDVVGDEKGFFVESYSHFLSKLWPRGIVERVSP